MFWAESGCSSVWWSACPGRRNYRNKVKMDRICSFCGEKYQHYNQKASYCRDCKRKYDREYHKNRTKEAKNCKYITQKKRRIKISQHVVDYLKIHHCVICGEDRIPCLQFDHVNHGKADSISNLVKSAVGIKKIMHEISKCRVLCANCHAIYTAEQFKWYDGIIF